MHISTGLAKLFSLLTFFLGFPSSAFCFSFGSTLLWSHKMFSVHSGPVKRIVVHWASAGMCRHVLLFRLCWWMRAKIILPVRPQKLFMHFKLHQISLEFDGNNKIYFYFKIIDTFLLNFKITSLSFLHF